MAYGMMLRKTRAPDHAPMDWTIKFLLRDGGREDAFFCSQIKAGVIVKGETKRLARVVQRLFDQGGELLSANGTFDRDTLGGPGCSGNGLALGILFERAHDRFFVAFRF